MPKRRKNPSNRKFFQKLWKNKWHSFIFLVIISQLFWISLSICRVREMEGGGRRRENIRSNANKFSFLGVTMEGQPTLRHFLSGKKSRQREKRAHRRILAPSSTAVKDKKPSLLVRPVGQFSGWFGCSGRSGSPKGLTSNDNCREKKGGWVTKFWQGTPREKRRRQIFLFVRGHLASSTSRDILFPS